MSESAVRLVAPGELHLTGVLDYQSGPTLRKQGAALINASELPTVILDCSGVEKSSSVGLALLLAFMRDAQQAGKQVTIRSMPDDMQKIARVSELTELLQAH